MVRLRVMGARIESIKMENSGQFICYAFLYSLFLEFYSIVFDDSWDYGKLIWWSMDMWVKVLILARFGLGLVGPKMAVSWVLRYYEWAGLWCIGCVVSLCCVFWFQVCVLCVRVVGVAAWGNMWVCSDVVTSRGVSIWEVWAVCVSCGVSEARRVGCVCACLFGLCRRNGLGRGTRVWCMV